MLYTITAFHKAPNQTLETNRRPPPPLDAGCEFGHAVHAQACSSGGGRSALAFGGIDRPVSARKLAS